VIILETVPAFPSETDPRFQEMLSKALAVPGDAPVGHGTDAALDLEAARREMQEAREWVRRNRHKIDAALDLEVSAPAGHGTDAGLDLEACRREMQEAREWVRRNRHKWAGPTAAAPKKARSTATSTPPAKARSMFAARRHRGVRRRPHHRVRLLSRAGPDEAPAPNEPDAPAICQPRAVTARLRSGAAALHQRAHVDVFAAEHRLAGGAARAVKSWGSAPLSTFEVYPARWAHDFATAPCRLRISRAGQDEADSHALVPRVLAHGIALALPFLEPRRGSTINSWGPALPPTPEASSASWAGARGVVNIAPPRARAESAAAPPPPRSLPSAVTPPRRAHRPEPAAPASTPAAHPASGASAAARHLLITTETEHRWLLVPRRPRSYSERRDRSCLRAPVG
jgi:hypothetical protein